MSKSYKKQDDHLTTATSGSYDDNLFSIQICDDKRLLTKKELAEFLNVSIKMIDRKVHMNEIPYLKIGRLVRFNKRSILAWANRAS